MTGLKVSTCRHVGVKGKKTYTSEEDKLGAVFLVLESRDQGIGVGIGKVESRTGSLSHVRLVKKVILEMTYPMS